MVLKKHFGRMELKKIAEKYTETDKFKDITFLAKMSLTVPVRNAWHERGTSAGKRVKSRTRSNIKMTYLMHC